MSMSMEEEEEQLVETTPAKPIRKRPASKYFTPISSSYSLRETPARTLSKPSTPNSTPQPKSLPRGYPSCVRVSAVKNSPSATTPAAPFRNAEETEARERVKKILGGFRKLCGELAEEEEKKQENKSTQGERHSGLAYSLYRERNKELVLGGFRKLCGELAEEEEKKQENKSTQGERHSGLAYSLYRERNKELVGGGVVKCLGGIPGVEVGDEFQFMFELFLLGLHCQLKYVDYMRQGERLVGISVVLVYDLWERMGTSVEALVFCAGKNPKKEQFGYGNEALKNNIEDKVPVRVILGFRDEESRKTTYVYGGLYLVEESWVEKGNHESRAMFRLRRLPEQVKLDMVGVMKSIRSRGDSVAEEEKDISPEQAKIDIVGVMKSLRSGGDSVSKEEKDLSPPKCKIQKVYPSSDSVEGVEFLGKRERVDEEKKEEEVVTPAEGRKRVKQTLHEFYTIYENLAEEYEVNQRGVPKIKNNVGHRARFDLDAYNLVREKRKDLSNMGKRMGSIPGVEVGDKFYYRVELCLLGVHKQLHSDIDFMVVNERILALSVVSFRLEKCNGNACNSNDLLCSGFGTKNKDQQMVDGNLALKNSIDAKTPVRVVHGFKNMKKNTLYFYYGLYLVEKYWRKKDESGHYIFMFRLRRLPGQANLDIKDPKKSLGIRSHISSHHIVDISLGKEKVPIKVVNTIDDDKLPPFKYRTAVIYPPNCSLAPLEGCNCVDGCTDSDACACAVRNGGELPFNSKGAIVEAKPLIYECGPSCKCPPSCHNRVTQHGMKIPLEIFKTKTMGWGVRSPVFIPSGSFVCEYIGELLEDEEAQKRSTDEYLFAIGNNYYDESLWEGLSSIPCLQKDTSSEAVEDGGFTVDASRFGNVGKFINHNCTPNLYAQNLLYDHDDKRMPHVVFFACEDIPPLQELFYHYNYTIDDVHDSDGNIRMKECYCGSIECTGRLY